MARVVAFVPDLLFGSRVIGALQAAGHDAALVSELVAVDAATTDVLVVDLTFEAAERISRVRESGVASGIARAKLLAFYLHTETAVKQLATDAGFDLVVPRSRMAREGAQLVGGLAS